MPIETMQFSAGESHVKIDLKNGNDVDRLIHDYGFGRFLYFPRDPGVSLNDYVMYILLIRDILQDADLSLFLPYLPYSRQDRRTHPGSPFSLKSFAKILETARFRNVYTLDAHSDVAGALIENLVDISITDMMQRMRFWIGAKDLGLIVPDQGACKRLSKVEEFFGSDVTYVIKQRNPYTGQVDIKGIFPDITYHDYMIMDDICDGGRTFIQIAEKLDKKHADLHLYTTHGIYSQGAVPLLEAGFGQLWTTDSFPQEPHPQKTVFSCLRILKEVMNGKSV